MEREVPNLFSAPAEEQYSALTGAYKYFNEKLFGGILPGCILNFSRKKNTTGFMVPRSWGRTDEKRFPIHEITLTTATLQQEPIELFGSLIHEMVHLWQWEYGNPSRGGYHNKQWADKMMEVGLIPSTTGQSGGKMTGDNVRQYVAPEGAYKPVFEKMPKKYLLPFTSNLVATTIKAEKEAVISNSRNKTKYSCPGCEVNVWGRPDLQIICGDCRQGFEIG